MTVKQIMSMLTKNFISSEESPSHSSLPYSLGLRAFPVPPPSCY